MRDLKKDLEVCKKATPGPWEMSRHHKAGTFPAHYMIGQNGEMYDHAIVLSREDSGEGKANAEFISATREGWPESISRAIAAEAEVKKLRKQRTEDIELMEETVEVQKLALAIITKLRKALALAHSMILGGEQHTEQSRQVIESALGLH